MAKNNLFFTNALLTPFLHYYRISYYVTTPSYVEVKIYSINGECFITLVNDYKAEGEYTIRWDGKSFDNNEIRAGIYFCQLRIGKLKEVRKIILLK